MPINLFPHWLHILQKRIPIAVIVLTVLLNPELRASSSNGNFVEVKEMIIPVIQSREVKGFFSVTFTLDCPTMSAHDKVQKYLPLLRDKIFWDLYILLGIIWRDDLYVDIQHFKQRLLRLTQQLLGKEAVKEVLIIDFQQYNRKNINFK
jgi:hypothetical protein